MTYKLRRRSKGSWKGATMVAASLLILIFPFDSQAEPIGLLLDLGREGIGTGETDSYSLAETGRASFVNLPPFLIRTDNQFEGSESWAVSSRQTLATSAGGTALLSSSAGGDSAQGSITLSGTEVSGDQAPLVASASDFQTLTLDGPVAQVGQVVPVDISYFQSIFLSSPDLGFSGEVTSRIWIFDREPILTPGDLGTEYVYIFNEIFSNVLSYSPATDTPVLSVDEVLDVDEIINLAVGSEYLVLLAAGGIVADGSAGLTLDAFADPIFSLDTCGAACADLNIQRQLTSQVPAPGPLALMILGLVSLRAGRPIARTGAWFASARRNRFAGWKRRVRASFEMMNESRPG